MCTGPGMLGCITWPCSLQHTLMWGEVPSVMSSSGRGTLVTAKVKPTSLFWAPGSDTLT